MSHSLTLDIDAPIAREETHHLRRPWFEYLDDLDEGHPDWKELTGMDSSKCVVCGSHRNVRKVQFTEARTPVEFCNRHVPWDIRLRDAKFKIMNKVWKLTTRN